MILWCLRVHERHVEEATLILRGSHVQPGIDRMFGQSQGAPVLRKGLRKIPEHVTRKLVKNDDSRECGISICHVTFVAILSNVVESRKELISDKRTFEVCAANDCFERRFQRVDATL